VSIGWNKKRREVVFRKNAELSLWKEGKKLPDEFLDCLSEFIDIHQVIYHLDQIDVDLYQQGHGVSPLMPMDSDTLYLSSGEISVQEKNGVLDDRIILYGTGYGHVKQSIVEKYEFPQEIVLKDDFWSPFEIKFGIDFFKEEIFFALVDTFLSTEDLYLNIPEFRNFIHKLMNIGWINYYGFDFTLPTSAGKAMEEK
jgi:hypothetical protein